MKKYTFLTCLIAFLFILLQPIAAQQRLFPENPVIVEMECEETLVKERTLSTNQPSILEYLWTDLATGETSTEPTFMATETGRYALSVLTAPDSLTLRDTVLVIFDAKCCRMEVPNAFTPNGDGRNDRFAPLMPPNCMITEFEMQVFNRWGKMVFQTNNPEGAWDGRDAGTAAPSDVYVYWLRYTAIGNNNTYNDSLRGNVTLIR
ncbi:MAG TPA: gliding motility-associated C-terminal domain-containing protein [Saprospiraceae bacterium]|nr:gliding motility-associated C-terminal domain-containing protein [Saprospiraceae bacterium]HMP25090.1 gliding motility-associated C-terminal domain-containing protein [Saprospiraceae bacterium]